MAGNADLFEPEDGAEGPGESTPSPFFKLVEAAEERMGGAAIGRPRGARNRKSRAFEDWYHARGYKDPAQLLGELVSADPLALVSVIGGKATMLDVVKVQIAAAGELMPYLHGKKPIDINVTDERLPAIFVMMADNQLDQAKRVLEERQKVLSPGVALVEGEANEIKDLEGEE